MKAESVSRAVARGRLARRLGEPFNDRYSEAWQRGWREEDATIKWRDPEREKRRLAVKAKIQIVGG